MRFSTFFIGAVIASSCCLLAADSPARVRKQVKTRDELVNTFGKSVGFGPVQRAEFSQYGRQVCVFWYCPFSGRAACFLHAYYYDPAKREWVLFVDRLVEGQSDLSVEMPSRKEKLVIRDPEGRVVLEESVAKLPAEEWYEKKP